MAGAGAERRIGIWELPPAHSLAQVPAATVGEAVGRERRNGPGRGDIEKKLRWLNTHPTSRTAREWGEYWSVFPNAVNSYGFDSIYQDAEGDFVVGTESRDEGWASCHRVVRRGGAGAFLTALYDNADIFFNSFKKARPGEREKH